jgi:hypothetical protein
MSDQYYREEDNLPDTPETIVANHDAQLASLDGLVQQTADQLTQAEQNLGWLYQDAEQRGDENAKLAVNNAWQITNQFAVCVTQFDAARLASAAMMHKFNELHRKLASDFEDLESAIAAGDEEHPMLSGFVEGIQEQAWNDMSDLAYDDAYDDAHEAVFYDFMMECTQRIHNITGSDDFGAINRLQNVILGDVEPTDQQRERIKQLLSSFEQIAMEQG